MQARTMIRNLTVIDILLILLTPQVMISQYNLNYSNAMILPKIDIDPMLSSYLLSERTEKQNHFPRPLKCFLPKF
jgi:hypothetical protein